MKKDVAFIIYYPYQWYVYKNIYNKLKDRSVFIVDLCKFNSNDGIDTLGSIINLLDENNVEYKILKQEDYNFSDYLTDFFSQFKVLVSVWEVGCMSIKETSAILKVCTTYGAGKELTMVRPSRGLYDLILSYGDRDGKLFSLFTTTIPIGNPKFDDFYSGQVDQGTIDLLSINTEKKTILYLPTHSDLSSFSYIMPKLNSLSKHYNVIAKMHYYNEREESEMLNKLNLNGVTLLKDDADLITLLRVCDVAISDNSSVIFDVIQADRPILIADFWDESFLDEGHKNLISYKRGNGGALTYSDSIEQIIKKEGRVKTFKKTDNISRKIKETLKEDVYYGAERKKIRQELFKYEDKNCGERGAKEIIRLINGEINSKKGIIFHANEASKITGNRTYRSMPSLIKEIDIYKKIALSEKLLTPYFLLFDTDRELTKLTLRSLLELSGLQKEIILISKYDAGFFTSNYKNVKCYESFDSVFNNIKKTDGVFLLESGSILNQIETLEILNFIKKEPELDLCLIKTKNKVFQTIETLVISLKLLKFKDVVSLSGKNIVLTDLYLYPIQEFKVVYIKTKKLYDLEHDKLFRSLNERVAIFSMLAFLPYSKTAIFTNFFKFDNDIDDKSIGKIREKSFEFFTYNLSKEKYELKVFVLDLILDIVKEKNPSMFRVRLLFYFFLILMRFYSFLHIKKVSLSKNLKLTTNE